MYTVPAQVILYSTVATADTCNEEGKIISKSSIRYFIWLYQYLFRNYISPAAQGLAAACMTSLVSVAQACSGIPITEHPGKRLAFVCLCVFHADIQLVYRVLQSLDLQ